MTVSRSFPGSNRHDAAEAPRRVDVKPDLDTLLARFRNPEAGVTEGREVYYLRPQLGVARLGSAWRRLGGTRRGVTRRDRLGAARQDCLARTASTISALMLVRCSYACRRRSSYMSLGSRMVMALHLGLVRGLLRWHGVIIP